MAKQVRLDGKVYSVPDDASYDEIDEYIQSLSPSFDVPAIQKMVDQNEKERLEREANTPKAPSWADPGTWIHSALGAGNRVADYLVSKSLQGTAAAAGKLPTRPDSPIVSSPEAIKGIEEAAGRLERGESSRGTELFGAVIPDELTSTTISTESPWMDRAAAVGQHILAAGKVGGALMVDMGTDPLTYMMGAGVMNRLRRPVSLMISGLFSGSMGMGAWKEGEGLYKEFARQNPKTWEEMKARAASKDPVASQPLTSPELLLPFIAETAQKNGEPGWTPAMTGMALGTLFSGAMAAGSTAHGVKTAREHLALREPTSAGWKVEKKVGPDGKAALPPDGKPIYQLKDPQGNVIAEHQEKHWLEKALLSVWEETKAKMAPKGALPEPPGNRIEQDPAALAAADAAAKAAAPEGTFEQGERGQVLSPESERQVLGQQRYVDSLEREQAKEQLDNETAAKKEALREKIRQQKLAIARDKEQVALADKVSTAQGREADAEFRAQVKAQAQEALAQKRAELADLRRQVKELKDLERGQFREKRGGTVEQALARDVRYADELAKRQLAEKIAEREKAQQEEEDLLTEQEKILKAQNAEDLARAKKEQAGGPVQGREGVLPGAAPPEQGQQVGRGGQEGRAGAGRGLPAQPAPTAQRQALPQPPVPGEKAQGEAVLPPAERGAEQAARPTGEAGPAGAARLEEGEVTLPATEAPPEGEFARPEKGAPMSRRAGAPPKPHVVIHAQKAIDFFVDQENLNPTDAEIVSQLQRQGMRSGTTADRIYDAARQVRSALKGEEPRYAGPTGEPKEPIVAPAPKGQLPVPPAEGPKGPLTYAKRGDKFVVLNSKNEVVSEHSSRSEALRKASRELGMENDKRAARSARFLRDENGRTPSPEELGLRPKEGEPGVFEGNVAEGTAKELEAALPKPGEEQYSPGVSALYEDFSDRPGLQKRVGELAKLPGWRKGIDVAHAAYEFFRNEVENSPVWKGLFPDFKTEKARGFIGQSERGRLFLGLTPYKEGVGSGPNLPEIAVESASREEFVARILGVATHEFVHGLRETSHKENVASSFTREAAGRVAEELGVAAKGVHPEQKTLSQQQLFKLIYSSFSALFRGGKEGKAPSFGRETPGVGLLVGDKLFEGPLFDALLEKFSEEDFQSLKKEGDAIRRLLAGKEEGGEALTAEGRAKRQSPLGFYSQLREVLDDDRTPAKATAADWLRFLKGKGVKDEELFWTGLEEKLKETGAKFTREELREAAKGGEVEVKEVQLTTYTWAREAEMLKRLREQFPDRSDDALRPIARQATDPRLIADRADRQYSGRRDVLHREVAARWSTIRAAALPLDLHTPMDLVTQGLAGSWRAIDILRRETPQEWNELLQAREASRDAAADLEADSKGWLSQPKYPSNYQLPGGTNVREFVLTVPKAEPWGADDTSHYGDTGEGRTVVWVRANDRTGPKGEKILFLEEVQSKRGQEGRERGFLSEEKRAALKLEVAHAEANYHRFLEELRSRYGDLDLTELRDKITREERTALNEAQQKSIDAHNDLYGSTQRGIPSAPFVTSTQGWTRLAVKRMLRVAAEEGYDKVAWTTGRQQAERYDLSKHVDEVRVWPAGKDNYYHYSASKSLRELAGDGGTGVDLDTLGRTLGRELASRAAEDLANGKNARYKGLDLKVGGEGMKAYYDTILPGEFEKVGKRFGVRVEKEGTSFETGETTKNIDNAALREHAEHQLYEGDTGASFILRQIERARTVTDAWSAFYNLEKDAKAGSLSKFGVTEKSFEIVEGILDKLALSRDVKVHSLPLTSELRAELLKGQPLFMEKGAEGAELGMKGKRNPYIIDAPSIARSSKKLKEQQKKIVGVGDLAYGYYVTNMIARLGTQLNNTRNVAVKASVHTLFDVLTMAAPDSRARLRQRRRAILDAVKDGFIDTPSVIFTDKPVTEGGKQIRALEEYGMKNLGKVIPSLFSQFSGEEIGTSSTKPERVLHALNLFGNIAERATVVNQIRISMAPLLEREGIAPGDYTTLLRKAATDKKLGERVTDALAQAAGDAGAIAFRRRPTIFKDEKNAAHAVLEAWNNFHPAAKIALSEGVTGTPFVNAILANALPDVVESWPLLSRLSKRFNKGREYEKLAERAGRGEKLAEKEAEKLREFRNNAMQSKAFRRASQLTGPMITLLAFGYYLTQDPKDKRAKGSLPTKEGWSTDVRNPLGSLYVGYALGEYLASAWKNRDKDKKMAPGKVGLGDLSPITQAVLQQRGSSQVGEGLLGQLAEATKPGAESFDYEKAFARVATKLGKNLPPSLLEGFGTDREAKMPEAPQEGDIPGVSPFLRGAQERIPGKREGLPSAWDPTSGEPRKTGSLGFQGLLPPETRYTPLRKYLDENADLFTNPPQLPRAKGEKLYDQRLMAAWKEKLDKGKVVVGGKGMTLAQLLAAPMDEAKKAALVEKALGQWTREASAAAQRGTLRAKEPVPLELKKKEEEKAYREGALKGTRVAKPQGATRPLRKSEIRNWGRYATKGKLPDRPTQ